MKRGGVTSKMAGSYNNLGMAAMHRMVDGALTIA